MTIQTSPSLLACNFLNLEREVRRAEESGCDMLHCDVMDGVYVPNISFGFSIISQIAGMTSLPLDVHMMTAAPKKYLETLKKAGASSVTLHTDVMAEEELKDALRQIRSLGMRAAVALKPGERAEKAFPFLPLCHMILVMTVEPGFGGQPFLSEMLPKIRAVRAWCDQYQPGTDLQVDGGIGQDTIEKAAEAGANVFVIGTAAFRSPDMAQTLRRLTRQAKEGAARTWNRQS